MLFVFFLFLGILEFLYFLLNPFERHWVVESFLSHLKLPLFDQHQWVLLHPQKSFIFIGCVALLQLLVVFEFEPFGEPISGRFDLGLFSRN
jgi:hypothetical protein